MEQNKTTQKRKRSENWGLGDKSLLKDLCAESITVIEDKTVDTNTNKKKRDRWNDIMISYNRVSDVKRDVAQLQFQWRAMKQRAKEASSEYRREKMRTGGGPPPLSPKNEHMQIIELIPKEFEVDSNRYDSDGRILQNPKDEYEYDDGDIEYLMNEVEYNSENIGLHNSEGINKENLRNDENNNTPACSPPIKIKKKKRQDKKSVILNTESEFKRVLYELTKEHMVREHEERMTILRIEKECRERELAKIELEIVRLRKL